jgi:NADH-quinone oxidoreductase subunit F
MRAGYRLKAVIPGGSSVPWLGADQLATPLDFESVQAAGSFIGSGGAIVIDDGVCAVDAGLNLTKFYRHESCGKCTPCREGGRWMEVILQRLEDGQGSRRDIADLKSIAGQILGRSLCALGDAAAMPVLSILEKFPDEFEHHVTTGKCVVNRRRTAVERARKGEPVLV